MSTRSRKAWSDEHFEMLTLLMRLSVNELPTWKLVSQKFEYKKIGSNVESRSQQQQHRSCKSVRKENVLIKLTRNCASLKWQFTKVTDRIHLKKKRRFKKLHKNTHSHTKLFLQFRSDVTRIYHCFWIT